MSDDSYDVISMGGQLHGVTSGRLARILGIEIEELHEPHNGMDGRYTIQTCDGTWVQNLARDSLWRFRPLNTSKGATDDE